MTVALTNEQIALAIEWTQEPDGTWRNTQGRNQKELPDFLRKHMDAMICVGGYFINWIPNSNAARRYPPDGTV